MGDSKNCKTALAASLSANHGRLDAELSKTSKKKFKIITK
jgi:hypothetical protein